jgi:hypothetical protein
MRSLAATADIEAPLTFKPARRSPLPAGRGERVALTRLVYIGSFGQSGSTLLESLMTANPRVVACGEIANGFEGRTDLFAQGSNASLNHDALVLTLLEHVKDKYAILCDSSKTAWGSIAAPFRLYG